MTKGNDILIESLNIMQYEQLSTIKKELLHIAGIASFFLRNDAAPYYRTFQDFQNRTKDYIVEISKISDKVKHNREQLTSYHSFLYDRDLIDKRIDKVLDGLKHLSNQIFQYSEESFNQYIPKPYLSRRYSSKAVSTYVHNRMESIQKIEQTEKPPNLSLLWDYRREYKMFSQVDGDYKAYVIETPFYYYELPYLIPNLFHELNHINIDRCDNKYQDIRKILSREIEKHNTTDNNLIELSLGLSEEIASDIFACDIFGEAYALSFFHTHISSKFYELFHDYELNRMRLVDFSGEEKYAYIAEIYIRLEILVSYIKHDDKMESKYIENISDFLKFIFAKSNSNMSLHAHYKKYAPRYYLDSFENFSSGIVDASKNFLRILSQNTTEKKTIEKNVFQSIWKHKMTATEKLKIPHRNILRKEILANIMKNEKKNLSFDPYELVFYKFGSNSNENIEQVKQMHENGVERSIYTCFGIYNNFSIMKKSDNDTVENVENFLKAINIKDSNKFYMYKIAMSEFYTSPRDKNGNEGCFGAVIQVQLKNEEPESIKEAYTNLKNALESEKVLFRIFKVLGPYDYVIIINNSKIDSIFTIKAKLVNEIKEYLRRTATTIFIDNDKEKKYDIDVAKYQMVSKIRIKYGKQISDVIEHLEGCDIFCLPGVVDIEARWTNNDFDNIMTQLDKIKSLTSDIQIEYVKRL